MSRRSVRTERRLFLADGPKAVEGALSVDGCVVEVFATPAAARAARRPPRRRAESRWSTTARSPRSPTPSSPAGVVAVCRHLDAPLEHVVRASPRLLVDLRRRTRPRQRRHRDPYGRRGRRRRGRAGRAVGRRLQPQDRARDRRQPVPPARSRSSPTRLTAVRAAQARGLTVLAADGAGEVDLFDADLSAPDGLALRQRGLGAARRAGRAGRPARRDPDPRPGREPQPVHRRGRVPLRQRPRPTDRPR